MEYNIGDEILTHQGYLVTIVDRISKDNYTVRYESGFEHLKVTRRALTSKLIHYPFHPTVFGIGYLGVGKFSSTTKDGYKSTKKGLSKAYAIWQGMLGRCYCPKVQGRQPSYKGDTVHPYWHNYQNFAKWFYANYVEGFAISKNILYKKCTVYSEETCCFVPMELNNAFIKRKTINKDLPIGVEIQHGKFRSAISIKRWTKEGAVQQSYYFGLFDTIEEAFAPYKKGKEIQIKVYARRWKKVLKPNVHEALLNYKVELTD